MTQAAWMTIFAGAVLLAVALVLLYPLPWVRGQEIVEANTQIKAELMNRLDEIKMSAAELEQRIAFLTTMEQRSEWIRWSTSFLFFALIAASLFRYVKTWSAAGKTGLFAAAVAYWAVWFLAVMTHRDGLGATVLDTFVVRILNELAVGNAWTLARWLLIYVLAPLASLALAFVLASGRNGRGIG